MPLAFCPLPARQEYALANVTSPSFRFGEAIYPSGLRIDDHAHRNPSVTFVLQGSLTEFYPRSRSESCVPCSILFRPPGERHRDLIGERGVQNLEIELTGNSSNLLPRLQQVFAGASQEHHPRLVALAQQIHSELWLRDTAQPLVLEGLSLEFLGLAGRVFSRARLQRQPPPWLQRVRELLQDRFREATKIADLAAGARVHPVYLARAFRLYYGVTPGVYLRRLRLEWAARELLKPSRPLAEIATAAGFSDQSHFTRAFRQHFGAPPGRMRRRVAG